MGWEHFAGHCYLALDQVDQDDDVFHAVVLLLLMMLTLIVEGYRESIW